MFAHRRGFCVILFPSFGYGAEGDSQHLTSVSALSLSHQIQLMLVHSTRQKKNTQIAGSADPENNELGLFNFPDRLRLIS